MSYLKESSVSSNEWTPTVPGHTADLQNMAEPAEPDPEMVVLAADDAVPTDVLDVSVERHGDAVVLLARGEVDALTTPLFSEQIDEQLDNDPMTIVLDLDKVTFLGSSGLAALINAKEQTNQRGIELRLVCRAHAVLRPLAATGLADQFDIYPDLAAALP
jgi:anti-sigma B factor antagonist